MFVLLDKAVHSKSSVTSRAKIKTKDGERLLSVPLSVKEVAIQEVKIAAGGKWQRSHWGAISSNYGKTPGWSGYKDGFEELYLNFSWESLRDFNVALIREAKRCLGIETGLILESDLPHDFGTGSARNLNICRHLGAKAYLSGAGGRTYNDEEAFARQGVELIYQQFAHPVYPQPWGEFIRGLSIIDLLFNCGEKSMDYLTGGNE